MINEYQIRKEKANEINNKINNMLIGLLIVGSVAYNPKAITSKSDLDLVAVLDFSNFDFKKLYNKLNQNYEPLIEKYAKLGKINNVSLVWKTSNFEIGLHLWDKTAFERVVNLKKINFIFRRDNFNKNFKSTSNKEILINLRGEKKEIFKNPKKVKGGHILQFYSFFEDEHDIYPGIQIFNLLLNPVILNDFQNYLSNNIEKFKLKLKSKLNNYYVRSSSSINLYNALNLKIKNKIPNSLITKLVDFF